MPILRVHSLLVNMLCGMMLCVVFPAHATETLDRVRHVEMVEKRAKSVRLEWSEQSMAQSYRVRVIENGSVIKKVKTKKHQAVIKGLKPDTVYTFRVRAKSDEAFGKFSYAKKVHTKIIIEQDSGTLFGFWGLNGYISAEGLDDVQNRLNATVFQVASSAPHYTVTSLLPLVRESGMKVSLRMTEDHDQYTTNGNFDIEQWKAQVDLWKDSGVQEFIDDGTLVSHMLLDDILLFDGNDPTAEELDEMARYSKNILPGLMTYVRQKAREMPIPENERSVYLYLDAIDNQYTSADGPVVDYAKNEYAAAKALGLAVINGLNIADGGDGSSGQPGWREGKYAMSAQEIAEYGEALLGVPHLQMMLLWEYDSEEQWSDNSIGSDYFDQAGLQEALSNLGLQASE